MNNIDYNKKILEHFQNPRNMGNMDNPDAEATVGNPSCLLPDENIFLDGNFQGIKTAKKENIVFSHSSLRNKIFDVSSRFYKGNIK